MSAPTLRATALGKRFGDRVALRDVTFELAGGEILAVIGPNGAGKTTLLSLLAGAISPSEGSVGAPPGERIGWVPQQTAVYSKLSVLENLELFARLERVADPAAAVAAMLEQTALSDRAGEQLGRLSGGNRQQRQQRRLAGPVGADHGEDLAAGELEGDVARSVGALIRWAAAPGCATAPARRGGAGTGSSRGSPRRRAAPSAPR